MVKWNWRNSRINFLLENEHLVHFIFQLKNVKTIVLFKRVVYIPE